MSCPFVFQVVTWRLHSDESACISASSRWTRTCPLGCWQGSRRLRPQSRPATLLRCRADRVCPRALCPGHGRPAVPDPRRCPSSAALRVVLGCGGCHTGHMAEEGQKVTMTCVGRGHRVGHMRGGGRWTIWSGVKAEGGWPSVDTWGPWEGPHPAPPFAECGAA